MSNTYTGRDILTVTGPAPPGEVVKQVQTEVDGLGRVLSVCQLSSASGTTSCGQDSGGTGYVTKYVYNNTGTVASVTRSSSTQSQSKTFTYDAAGRVISATYPESGTTQYFFDVAPSTPGAACSVSTYNGKLVKSYDANGNTTCYTYDGIGRTTSVVYSGPNADGYNTYFVYDAATVNGTAMSGTLSHLAEAYTAPTAGGTKHTDEGFSYDAMGRLTDVYENTPNHSSYFHTTATYFENGALKSLGGMPGQSTYNFTIDAKGRPNGATQGSTALINSVTYNTVDQVLTTNMGLGDTDAFTYDSNTNAMKTFTFSVGATPTTMVGSLNWNTNGTLQQLAITNGFNSGGTMTCNYGTSTVTGYDEFGRLLSVDCGSSIWQQTFSYDPFGNISKSGTSSWLPGYNQANNHELGSTYDSNGNLLTDTFHTYVWNQYNKPKSLTDTGVSMTYDALGRLVEEGNAGVYTQYVQSPIGKVYDNAAAAKYIIPLPGRIVYMTGKFYHSDWLGNVRLVSGRTGRTSSTNQAYAPYGEIYKQFGTGGIYESSFTGDTQDIAAGTYDTPSREMNAGQGRWISPDPVHDGWNGYAYSSNPMSETDPSGLGNVIEGIEMQGEYSNDFSPERGRGSTGGIFSVTAGDPALFGQAQVTTEHVEYMSLKVGSFSATIVFASTMDTAGGAAQNQVTFDALWKNYPSHEDYPTDPKAPNSIWSLIGGKVEKNEWTKDENGNAVPSNSCAVRMSYALNESGLTIPKGKGTVSGADGSQYFLRVADLQKFLTGALGQPQHLPGGSFGGPGGKSGILSFNIPFRDATGHFTLWNGKSVIDPKEPYQAWPAPKSSLFWGIQ